MANFKLVDVSFYYNEDKDLPNNEFNYLCAIGEYDENDKECEDIDDKIFYWFDSEEELIGAKEYQEGAELTVLNYKIRDHVNTI